MVFFSRSALERALSHYVAPYHEERNHQGLQNRLLKCSDDPINLGGRVQRGESLGGMLNFYHREAASTEYSDTTGLTLRAFEPLQGIDDVRTKFG